MIAGNNEDKRSKIWNILMGASTIVIIVIVLFFVVKIFRSNPLQGTWVSDGDGLIITVDAGDKAKIQWPEKFSNQEVSVGMIYSINKDSKILQLKIDADEIAFACKNLDGLMTEEEIRQALSSLESTFDYSVDGKELTLTDREYGDQMFFEKR